MNLGDMIVQGVDLEMAECCLSSIVGDIERLKIRIAELLDDDTFTGDDLKPGSRFMKLIAVKSFVNSMGIDAFRARTHVRSALAYQQASLPTPEEAS